MGYARIRVWKEYHVECDLCPEWRYGTEHSVFSRDEAKRLLTKHAQSVAHRRFVRLRREYVRDLFT